MRHLPLLAFVVLTGCTDGVSDTCQPGDQDGVTGGSVPVAVNVSVSDTTFAVNGVPSADSGIAPQRNIAVQNATSVVLTVTNVGSKPHDSVFHCIPSGLPSGCSGTSCFPASANVPALVPGAHATTTFETPLVEGAYLFTSDEPGDTTKLPDGGPTGLVGEIVLE